MRLLSRLGSHIEVRNSWGVKSLYINGYPQSQWAYLSDWRTIFARTNIDQLPKSGSALVLGLGGGDVIKLLAHSQPKMKVAAVELEREVVQVAKDYFGILSSKNLKIVTADAKQYMTANKNLYDMIIIDLYSGDDVPTFVSTNNFLKNVSQALKPHGKAIFNYASHSFGENDFNQFESKLKVVFGSVSRIITWGHTYFVINV